MPDWLIILFAIAIIWYLRAPIFLALAIVLGLIVGAVALAIEMINATINEWWG